MSSKSGATPDDVRVTRRQSGRENSSASAMPESARDLKSTVASFWPGAEVTYDGTKRGAAAVYHYVPNARRPRLLVPGRPRGGAARAMLRFSSTLSPKEVIGRGVLASALGLAGPEMMMPDRITVHKAQDSLTEHMSTLLGEPVAIAITIGNARVNRKPVVQVFDGRGRVLAYAKIGDSDVSRADVRGEATSLRAIEGRLEGFEVPRLISLTEWQGMVVMLITAVRTSPQNPRLSTSIPLAAMDSFSLQLGHTTAALTEVPHWAAMRSISSGDLGGRLGDLMRKMEEIAETAPDVTVGSWHGDWTGWNMARRRGLVQLWDFERFSTGVVQGMDAFHYAINAATLRGGISDRVVRIGLEQALEVMGDGVRQRIVAGAYLATIAHRYCQSVAGEHGDLIVKHAATIIEALEWWLPQIHGARR